jgi:hypothetical protein
MINQFIKHLIVCFLMCLTTPIMANMTVFKHHVSDTIIPKRPPKLATDPSYVPLTPRLSKLLVAGTLCFFAGIGMAYLVLQYAVKMSLLAEVFLLAFAFIFFYGGLLTIIWGLLKVLIRWMKSVNRRRVADNRKKVKWWFWTLLSLIAIMFIAMSLILGF